LTGESNVNKLPDNLSSLPIIWFLTYNVIMKCPNDNADMSQVKIESNYGQPILLEQCRECGGIWFDETELFSARNGEAEKIDVFDSKSLWTPANIVKRIRRCPLDQSELFRFKDRYFLKGIILERCPSCNGIWLNRGDFTKFQQARKELKRPKDRSSKDKRLEEDIKSILASYRAETTSNTLEKLGGFLSAPIDRATLLPLGQSWNQLEQRKTGNSILDALMLVLIALIRRI
jgi:Zn-finger nucleic acid-binding protein